MYGMCKGPEVRVDSCVGRTARSPGWSEQSEWEESRGMLRAQEATGARWDLMGGGEVGGFPSTPGYWGAMGEFGATEGEM